MWRVCTVACVVYVQVRALLMLKLGKPREARQAVDEGLAANPTHAPLYRVLGAMQDVAGDVEAARASFREGLRLNPGCTPPPAPSSTFTHRPSYAHASHRDEPQPHEARRSPTRLVCTRARPPADAQLYHAFARLEGKLGNWGALNELNQMAARAFPVPEPQGGSALHDDIEHAESGQQ